MFNEVSLKHVALQIDGVFTDCPKADDARRSQQRTDHQIFSPTPVGKQTPIWSKDVAGRQFTLRLSMQPAFRLAKISACRNYEQRRDRADEKHITPRLAGLNIIAPLHPVE